MRPSTPSTRTTAFGRGLVLRQAQDPERSRGTRQNRVEELAQDSVVRRTSSAHHGTERSRSTAPRAIEKVPCFAVAKPRLFFASSKLRRSTEELRRGEPQVCPVGLHIPAILKRQDVQTLIDQAIAEDDAHHDVTTRSVLRAATRIEAKIVSKATGVLAGGSLALWVFQTLDPTIRASLDQSDGAILSKGSTVLSLRGRARSIFAAERTALNFLGHLSGVATLTHEFVQKVATVRVRNAHGKRGTSEILDTRKTLPILRALEKYAVKMGGGKTHRSKLSDAILIKTNHLLSLKQVLGDKRTAIEAAILRARKCHPHLPIEIEVTSLSDVRAALRCHPDIILLDNMSVLNIRHAVSLRQKFWGDRKHPPLLEASGRVNLKNIRLIARTGIERISIGQLTHSAPALDFSLVVVSK